MKKILITALIAVSTLYANSYTKADRIKDMHKMAAGMKLIQNGFLYRCPEHSCLIDGAERILDVVKTLETQEMKDFLPDDQKYAFKFGQKSARMIELYAKDLIDSAKSNNMDDALEDYNQILRQCASCHLRLRK
ncbi:MAG: hypothetical protein DSY46_04475 [Hydrogenimonas sp.]|nr:MAG: hypothetical protein DSY46_04475 [Hydrogenimonas sp.]